MTVWTLATHGRHGSLYLGQSWQSVKAAFGAPTDWGTNNKRHASVYKYDDIELHFIDEQLWLVHCEIGLPPAPRKVQSALLSLQPGGLVWPTSASSLSAAAASSGVALHSAEDVFAEGAQVFTAGLAKIALYDDWLVWSISQLH